MATWKKVIVSGSKAELSEISASVGLAVGANQLITTNTAKLTGSFTGSFTGDGSGLTGIAATTITAGNISDIANQGDFLYVSQSDGIKKITYQNFLTDLTNGTDSNLEVDGNTDGIKLKANISVTQITASIISASTYIGLPSFQTPSSLTQGAGIDTFSFNGSSAATVKIKTGSVFADNVILKWDTGANQFESSSLSDVNGVVSGTSSIQLTGNASSLTGSFTGSFFGNGQGLTGVGVNITSNTANYVLRATGVANTLSASAGLQYDQDNKVLQVNNTIKFSGSVANSTATLSSFDSITTASIFAEAGTSPNTVKIGNPTSITYIGNDLVINGDLVANGTSSFINTQNLLVSDRFITLASSSTPTTTDGGIIIQNSSSPAGTGSGYAFYLETANNDIRWAVTSSLNLNATGGTPDEYMVTAKIASSNPTGDPTWGGSAAGAGNIYVNTTDQSIWIYS